MEFQELCRALNVFGHLLATMVEVEGLKAENAWRASLGETPPYGEEAFEGKAAVIHSLAESIYR